MRRSVACNVLKCSFGREHYHYTWGRAWTILTPDYNYIQTITRMHDSTVSCELRRKSSLPELLIAQSDLLADTYASDALEHAKDRAVARCQQRHPGNTCKVIDPPCRTFGWGTQEISLGQVIIDQMAQHELAFRPNRLWFNEPLW